MLRPSTLTRTVRTLLVAAAMGFCLAPVRAQSDDVAKVIVLQGRVSVLRGSEIALWVNSAVKPKEIIVTGPDGYAQFQIGDGSTFEVFPNSRVTFCENFGFTDFLTVMIGKIRAVIEHRNGPNHKQVSTPTAVISVRGTVFDVTVEDVEGTTLVSVEEGVVGVRHAHEVNGGDVLLHPTEWLRVFPNQRLAKLPNNSPGGGFIRDAVKRAAGDWAVNNPGGSAGGGIPGNPGGTAGGNGDNTKKKGTGPGAPPPGK